MLDLEDSALDIDQVENLIKFCPTKEEMDLLKVGKLSKLIILVNLKDLASSLGEGTIGLVNANNLSTSKLGINSSGKGNDEQLMQACSCAGVHRRKGEAWKM